MRNPGSLSERTVRGHVAFEETVLPERAGGVEALEVGKGWGGRGSLEMGVAGGRDDESLLIADAGDQHTEGLDLGRGVEPDTARRQIDSGDDVVEDGGRGELRHGRDVDTDESRRGGEAFCVQESFEEGVLILAIAVLGGEYLRGGVRLVRPMPRSMPT